MGEMIGKTLRQFVEVERKDCEMPEPANLFEKAKDVEPAPRFTCASDYGESINLLREKGYTWNEIAQWFKGNGVDYSMQAINAGWRTWKLKNTGGF